MEVPQGMPCASATSSVVIIWQKISTRSTSSSRYTDSVSQKCTAAQWGSRREGVDTTHYVRNFGTSDDNETMRLLCSTAARYLCLKFKRPCSFRNLVLKLNATTTSE